MQVYTFFITVYKAVQSAKKFISETNKTNYFSILLLRKLFKCNLYFLTYFVDIISILSYFIFLLICHITAGINEKLIHYCQAICAHAPFFKILSVSLTSKFRDS